MWDVYERALWRSKTSGDLKMKMNSSVEARAPRLTAVLFKVFLYSRKCSHSTSSADRWAANGNVARSIRSFEKQKTWPCSSASLFKFCEISGERRADKRVDFDRKRAIFCSKDIDSKKTKLVEKRRLCEPLTQPFGKPRSASLEEISKTLRNIALQICSREFARKQVLYYFIKTSETSPWLPWQKICEIFETLIGSEKSRLLGQIQCEFPQRNGLGHLHVRPTNFKVEMI